MTRGTSRDPRRHFVFLVAATLAAGCGVGGGEADATDAPPNGETAGDGRLDAADDDADRGVDAFADGHPLFCLDDAECADGDACNGVETCDHGACLGGTPLPDGAACDDGDRCTSFDFCATDRCTGRNTCACTFDDQCGSYEDGDLCNGTLACVDRACAVDPSTVVVCDRTGDTECLARRCVPSTGVCVPTPAADGSACSDGNPCSPADACASGRCVGGPSTCACRTTGDCSAHEDGDACNGTLLCMGGACVTDAATVVVCDVSSDAVCRIGRCEPSTGACVPVLRTDGSACDDADPCTWDTICAGGECVGERIVCEDDNPCSVGSCTPDEPGCVFDFSGCG